MRKAIPAILLTAAGFVLVWQYEPLTSSSQPAALPAPTTTPEAPASSSSSAPTTSSGSGSGSSGGGGVKTVDGSAERNQHGTVQVRVTFDGDKITGVQFLQLPNTGPSKMAGPRLVQETLQAQTANVDSVSGATQTSRSYIGSLQAAIDAKGA